MGCQQSTDTSVSQPTKIQQIFSLDLPQTLKHNQPKKNQIYSIPNDQFHLRWMDNIRQSVTNQNLQALKLLAYQMFIYNYIQQCMQLCKRIIQFNPFFCCSAEGLGFKQMATGKYQWGVTQWYTKQIQQQKIKLSHYDLLSLSFLTLTYADSKKYSDQLKKGLSWYQGMLIKYPQNIPIMMGYANLFSCRQSFDEALKLFQQVIQKDAYFKNAYISKALIHEYKRINLQTANEIATKINYLFESNEYAEFILARNLVDIDQKISKLKQVATKHPYYVRIINQVGICYGAKKKDYDQAIEWYRKCVQLQPQYYSAYNNIGVNFGLKKNYQQARKWYYNTIIVMDNYKASHNNLVDVYIQIGFTNQQIQAQVKSYENIKFDMFCWQIGSAFYNKRGQYVKRAIYWHDKSVQLKPQRFEYWNSLGVALDDIRQCEKAIQKYLKAVELNPQYQIGYYNIALAYKKLNMLDKTEQYYIKAVEINPKYSYAWNNLANIYKNKKQYQQAIEYYQHALEYNSTYTLALANLGICELKLGKFKQAFGTFSKAKAALQNDNNNLNQANKLFLKQNLDKFDKQGQKWKQSGSVTDQQKQSLKLLIQQFESKFKNITAAVKHIQVPTQKIFQPQILQIIKILKQDQFQLKKISQIFQLISTIFHQDQEYFHIVPLLIIQKFTTNVFVKNQQVMAVEKDVKNVMTLIAQNVAKKQIQSNNHSSKNKGQSTFQPAKFSQVKLKQSIITNSPVNLFQDRLYFSNAEQLYIQVKRINVQAKKSYTDFSLLVQQTRKKSNGLPGGISTKIPSKQSQQFKVMLRIMQKLFKKQMNQQRKLKIIQTINQKLKQITQPTLDSVVRQVTTSWNNQITSILNQRKQNKVQTHFTISDLLRARCIYTNIGDLIKAVQVVDQYCKVFGYEVIEMNNRLAKRQTQDVVFKIKIKKAACQLQLAMKQDQKLTHLDHCVYEILRSPLGVIFGSYLFMSKQVKYPFTTNCKDIVQKLQNDNDKKDDMKLVKQCAQYVLGELQRVNTNDSKKQEIKMSDLQFNDPQEMQMIDVDD